MTGSQPTNKFFHPFQDLRDMLESMGEAQFLEEVILNRPVLMFGTPQGVDADETVATEKLFEASSTKNAADPSSWYQDTAAILKTRHSEPNQIRVGRNPDCDLILVLPSVDKAHALLEETPRGWRAQDLGSKHGTFLNDVRLEPEQSYVLHDGDTIRFGRYLPLRLCEPASLLRILDPSA